jgi:two-component system NtrC family sensor kinase
MNVKIINKLGLKLGLVISIVLISLFLVYTYITINFLHNYLNKVNEENAYSLSEVVKMSTRHSMLLNKRDDIYESIRGITNEPNVRKIRIYNKQGYISYSTDSSEVGKKVDINSDACVACHSKGNFKKDLDKQENYRLFSLPSGERVMGVINAIQNEPDCYNAACHAHSSNAKLLGVLDVMMSMKPVDEAISLGTRSILITFILITLLVSGLSVYLIFVMVNKPLGKFSKGINELGKGNWNFRIRMKSKDEFGMIAGQFNEMSKQLSNAYNEIKEWNETLNTKVDEKTKELKNIYEQIIQMEKLASLGKMSATVAHELNNPLEGILTYSKLISKKLRALNDGTDYTKVLDFLEIISDESARCGKIVKDLLLFSHSDLEEFTNADLIKIVERCIALINHRLEMEKIKLAREFEKDSFEIICNAQKIQQAVLSLLINAIESMSGVENGEIKIKINSENKFIVIRISDKGTGIKEKDLPHIFDPFYTTKEFSKGTGLGLSVVYGIINMHNGKIVVENTSDAGTTFKISLPARNSN